jgi:3-deoxy-manno-octulosonate cytidylyltransferase (CMP-KDO synthetase)
MDFNRWLIVIPARLNSERLPRKPLADLAGRPLIARVYENLKPLEDLKAKIIVAVDHVDTAKACEVFKIPFVMTSDAHQSGTDRCAEVARTLPDRPYILNVQGDEPFVELADLQNLMTEMNHRNHVIGTMGFQRFDREGFEDPNVVKIVSNSTGKAIYFSRAPVPFDRDASRDASARIQYTQHIGVYAFKRETLLAFCDLPPSKLEKTEKLEQLRAIEEGWSISIVHATTPSLGIDTPEDLKKACKRFS